MEKHLVFIGTVKSIADCGEAMKNHLFIEKFRPLFEKMDVVDIFKPRQHPLCILKMVLLAILHPKSKFVVSVSTSTAYKVLKLLTELGVSNIYYWVVGGCMTKTIVERGYDLSVYKGLKMLYVQSPKMVKDLASIGIDNVMYVPNSKPVLYKVDLKDKEYDPIRFVFVSSIIPEKGCRFIIDAAKKLNDKGLNNRFIVDFYGNAEFDYKDEFMNSIQNLSNVNYRGFLNLKNADGYKTLSNYSVMLFPTYWEGEGFPGSVIDSFFAALPIIASNWNFNADIIKDDVTGFIIPPKDGDALYDKMYKIINGDFDLLKMSSNCIKESVKYDNNNILSTANLSKIKFI